MSSLFLCVTSHSRDAINKLRLKQHIGIFEHSVLQRHDHKLQTAVANTSRAITTSTNDSTATFQHLSFNILTAY